MLRVVWGGTRSTLARPMFVFGACLAAVAVFDGCDSSGSSGSSCPAGSEACACYGNGTCNEGLVCASKLCVSLGDGGATSSGGASSAGASGLKGGASALGGNVGNGGEASAAGLASSLGGNGVAGSEQGLGGASALQGGSSSGGNSNGGAPNGGAVIAGAPNGGINSGGAPHGGAVNAGAPNGGTSNNAAGAPNGGTPAIGGVGGVGGVPSNGGASVAGQASTGGTGVSPTCGNGILDGAETCDVLPRDFDMGDGCTPTCMAEPTCPAAGGPCTSRCGDGLVFDNEACDDGNVTDGDGCSATCTVEPNYACAQPPLGDTMVVPLVVRDFNAGADFEKGTAFSTGLNYATVGLLQTTLDTNGLKPVLVSTTGTFNGKTGKDSGIASAASFAQWYNDAAAVSGNARNGTLANTLTLYRSADGSAYVNRDGANGEQYQRTTSYYCGNIGLEDHDAANNPIPCTSCIFDEDTSTPQCDPGPDPTDCTTRAGQVGCVQQAGAWYGKFLVAAFDGTPLWFPADGIKPFSPSATAMIPGNFDPTWPVDASGALHNFSFTTEVRFWFKYDSTKPYKLNIMGDDDIWVFVNKHLAVDMGGIHTPVAAELSIASDGIATVTVTPTNVPTATSTTSQPDLGGLQNGGVYEIAIFHADRMTRSSSYQIGLPGFNTNRSVCTPQP